MAAGNTFLVITRTLYLETLTAFSIQLTLAWVVTLLAGSATKFSVYTTESASNSSPLWNLTPSRKSNSIVRSSICFQLLARLPLYSLVMESR